MTQYFHISYYFRDTAGTEKFCSLAKSYKGAHGIYIVYDITNFDSLCKLNEWIKHIETVSIV